MIDRSEVSRALAKALAFKAVGNDHAAASWAIILIKHLECADILAPEHRIDANNPHVHAWKLRREGKRLIDACACGVEHVIA